VARMPATAMASRLLLFFIDIPELVF